MHKFIAIAVAVAGGFFSLALMFVEGINSYGNWDEHAFLGAILLFICIGMGSIISQLSSIDSASKKNAE